MANPESERAQADDPGESADLASAYTLGELVGKRVRTIQEFSGIPKWTEGVVTRVVSETGARRRTLMVKWTTTSGHEVEDGFGRDVGDFDETQWLEVL